jgi:hypothetical protein
VTLKTAAACNALSEKTEPGKPPTPLPDMGAPANILTDFKLLSVDFIYMTDCVFAGRMPTTIIK